MSVREKNIVKVEDQQFGWTMPLGELLNQVARETERLGADACTITFSVPTPRGVLIVSGEFRVLQRLERVH